MSIVHPRPFKKCKISHQPTEDSFHFPLNSETHKKSQPNNFPTVNNSSRSEIPQWMAPLPSEIFCLGMNILHPKETKDKAVHSNFCTFSKLMYMFLSQHRILHFLYISLQQSLIFLTKILLYSSTSSYSWVNRRVRVSQEKWREKSKLDRNHLAVIPKLVNIKTE